MLSWLKRRPREEPTAEIRPEPAAAPQGHGMSKTFLALHEYLKGRYSDVAFLTFAQMEELIGSPFPRRPGGISRGGTATTRPISSMRIPGGWRIGLPLRI